MTTSTTRQSSVRTLVIALGLLLAGLFAASPASATTLIPLVDAGGPGGGGGSAQTVDAPVVASGIGVLEF